MKMWMQMTMIRMIFNTGSIKQLMRDQLCNERKTVSIIDQYKFSVLEQIWETNYMLTYIFFSTLGTSPEILVEVD